MNRQEKFVFDHVKKGGCVAFSPVTPQTHLDVCPHPVDATGYDKTLSSEFIQNLLTGAWKGTKLKRPLVINGAIFHGPLTLRGIEVPVEVFLTNSQFDDDVDFSSTHFPGSLYLNGSKFTKPTANLNFNSMNVAGVLALDDVEAAGKPQFFHLSVNGDVFIKHAQFTGDSWTVPFNESDIRGTVFIEDSMFKSSLSIAQGDLNGLSIERATVQDTLDLGHSHVGRVLELSLAKNPNHIALAGLTYGDLASGAVAQKLEDLIDEVSKDNYNAQPYSQLEDYYRTHGAPETADEVYIHRKRLERRSLSWPSNWFSWFVDKLVGYGRKPQYALYFSLGVVSIGTVIFWQPSNMVLQEPDKAPRVYNPFWYSLDLVTPFIDLEAARVWMPRQDWWFGRHYARLHRILGWILVPIGLAAITGIIK